MKSKPWAIPMTEVGSGISKIYFKGMQIPNNTKKLIPSSRPKKLRIFKLFIELNFNSKIKTQRKSFAIKIPHPQCFLIVIF